MPEALALLEHQDQQGSTASATASATARAAAARDGDSDSEVRYSFAQCMARVCKCGVTTGLLAAISVKPLSLTQAQTQTVQSPRHCCALSPRHTHAAISHSSCCEQSLCALQMQLCQLACYHAN
jgi:hypothetical protein